MALWSFFLLQAAFVYVPARLTCRATAETHKEASDTPDGFARAYQAAEQALRLMPTHTIR
jgi:hypothetical protein